MDWNPFVPRRDRGRRVEMNGTRDEMERSGSLFSLSRRPTGACVARARHRARTRFSKPGEKRPRASPLLEINGQFMEIGWMYGNWLATSWRYAGGGPPAGARMAFRRGYTHETAAVFVYFPREEEEATRGEKRGSIVDDDNRGNPLISQTRSRIPYAS